METAAGTGRRLWMGLLAHATLDELEMAWSAYRTRPGYVLLRPPEAGAVMVRGRTGGTGDAFNLGEMTMTRCAVRLTERGSASGFGYVAGRKPRHAELAALFDAMLQEAAHRDYVQGLLDAIDDRRGKERASRAAEVAATKVDFLTLVREQSNAG